MSRKTLRLYIVCGEKTCASEPGKFCRFVGVKNFGTVYVCLLFPELEAPGDTSSTYLKENDEGWLARCTQCLEAEALNFQ